MTPLGESGGATVLKTAPTGEGALRVEQVVVFQEPFLDSLNLMVSLSMWHIDQVHNARVNRCAEKISAKGSELVFRRWQDSRVAPVRNDWIVLGAKRDDDWDVEYGAY